MDRRPGSRKRSFLHAFEEISTKDVPRSSNLQSSQDGHGSKTVSEAELDIDPSPSHFEEDIREARDAIELICPQSSTEKPPGDKSESVKRSYAAAFDEAILSEPVSSSALQHTPTAPVGRADSTSAAIDNVAQDLGDDTGVTVDNDEGDLDGKLPSTEVKISASDLVVQMPGKTEYQQVPAATVMAATSQQLSGIAADPNLMTEEEGKAEIVRVNTAEEKTTSVKPKEAVTRSSTVEQESMVEGVAAVNPESAVGQGMRKETVANLATNEGTTRMISNFTDDQKQTAKNVVKPKAGGEIDLYLASPRRHILRRSRRKTQTSKTAKSWQTLSLRKAKFSRGSLITKLQLESSPTAFPIQHCRLNWRPTLTQKLQRMSLSTTK